MLKNIIEKVLSLLLIISIVITGCAKEENVQEKKVVKDNSQLVARTTPYGKYPETVVYTLGKMTGVNNSNMPSGDTYEDNAYTRYLYQKLNIKNVNIFTADESGDYSEKVSMAISSGNLPDIMVVQDYSTLKMLVENDMIQDLTQEYENCSNSRIRSVYESYGKDFLDSVTFNGKLMAIPGTNIENGPSLLWLRQDWLDKLGLKSPKTIDDVCDIVRQFIKKDPGNNGKGGTVGLACNADITGGNGYSYEYQMDTVFASYGAYPKHWLKDGHGSIVYGSVQSSAKEGLKKLASMYLKGYIDEDFLLRGDSNIVEMVVNGQCGAFFGPWWAPNNPLMNSVLHNSKAKWKPYLIQTDSSGSTSYTTQNPHGNYVVVRKGYKHPEVAVKIISVLFDNFKYDKEDIGKYYQKNVDATARPLAINVDYKDALMRSYHAIRDTLHGKSSIMDLELLEGAYYKSCRRYEKKEKDTVEDWAAYTSRITACSLIDKGNTKKVKSYYVGDTPSMNKYWWKLEKLEREAYLAIITGKKPISYFDEFVKNWYKQGGKVITKEVEEAIQKK